MIFSKYGLQLTSFDNESPLSGAIGFCKETNEQRMKTFLSEQHATNRNKDSNDEMVNEFKLTVVYFARPNPCRSVHARGFTSGQKNCGKSGLGHRATGPPGRGAEGLLLAKRHFGVPFWCTNMASANQQKHLELTFSIKALSFQSRTSIRALEIVIPLKIKRRDFFQRHSIPILVSSTEKTSNFKLLYVWNETCYGNGNLYKDILLVHLQPSVIKNA